MCGDRNKSFGIGEMGGLGGFEEMERQGRWEWRARWGEKVRWNWVGVYRGGFEKGLSYVVSLKLGALNGFS